MTPIETFLSLIEQNKPKIAVAGDVVLDMYYYGKIDRINPEFPSVPILTSQKQADHRKLGGAANVADQLIKLGIDAKLFAFEDVLTRPIFGKIPLAHAYSYVPSIPRKNRFYCDGIPVFRWDVEVPDYGSFAEYLNKIHQKLHDRFLENNPKIMILSDYDKGFFSDDSIKLWLNKDLITIVDPKKGPISKWKGCTIIKPNSKEAKDLSGFSDLDQQMDYFLRETEAKFVVITLGAEGVICKSNNGKVVNYQPKRTVHAKSVVGAGDSFVAVLSLAYANGMPIEECIEVAFEIGALYVQKGTDEAITQNELLHHISPIQAKFVHVEDLIDIENLVFTNGCFDLGLTQGHVLYLEQAKKLGQKLVVALNSDRSIKEIKGNSRPVMSLEERKFVVAALECVDFVVDFDEATPLELIKKIKPSLIVKGGDYKPEEVVGRDICPVVVLDKIDCVSTTDKIGSV